MEKQHQFMRYLTAAGLFAAMIAVVTAYVLHIPYGLNGGYIHLGDALIYLAASILPLPYAMGAAAIGAGIADLLTMPIWTPATIVIKSLTVLAFSHKKGKILCGRNVFACAAALVINVIGYYLAEMVLFGAKAAFIASATGNLIQSAGSTVLFLILAAVLDKAHVLARFGGDN